jgi:hypothetical protein
VSVIAFFDDQIFSHEYAIRGHPLMSSAICVVTAKAIQPGNYPAYLAWADNLIKDTFQGTAPDIMAVKAMMLLAAWTGRSRLWGYIASLAAELGLNVAAIKLEDDSVDKDKELIDRARTWFSLCCFDLVYILVLLFVVRNLNSLLTNGLVQDKRESPF